MSHKRNIYETKCKLLYEQNAQSAIARAFRAEQFLQIKKISTGNQIQPVEIFFAANYVSARRVVRLNE